MSTRLFGEYNFGGVMLSSRYPNNGFTARLGGHRKIYIISRQDKMTQQK